MKKIIAIILCFVLLLGVGAVAVFGSGAEILQKIGIMKGTENGLETERLVTRAEALPLIYRVWGIAPETEATRSHFTDVDGHWASKTIVDAYLRGYIAGVSETEFAPEEAVTGRQFVKMLLSVLGYEGVTIENAYDRGDALSLLLHNETKTAVQEDWLLTRDVTASICHSALLIKTPDGRLVKQMLVDQGLYTEADFSVMGCGTPAAPVHFADKLNAQMPEKENYMFSPFSVKLAFALAANGAQKETQQEILDALGIADLDAFNQEAKQAIEKYNAAVSMDLNVANAVWVNTSRTQGKQITGPYEKLASAYFDAQAATVTDADAVGTINAWVQEKTNGKISKIAENNEFFAYIANAVYFKAGWLHEFAQYLTKQDAFYNADGTVTSTDFMQQTTHFNYGEAGGVRILELPYKNYVYNTDAEGKYAGRTQDENIDISMFVLSGNGRVHNPQAVLESAQLRMERVHLSMPKFEAEFKADLKEMMRALGVQQAFDSRTAQIRGIIEQWPLYIDAAVHKTYIQVDEKGTEAAAVTGIAAGATSSRPAEPIEFKLDKPFTYIIRDNLSGEVLFAGAYVQVEK